MEIEFISTTSTIPRTQIPTDTESDYSYSYCPDFSDMYDDKSSFWDFFNSNEITNNAHCQDEHTQWAATSLTEENTSENIDDLERREGLDLSEYRRNNNEVTVQMQPLSQFELENSSLASCKFWDFLNLNTDSTKKTREDIPDPISNSQQNFWDFIPSALEQKMDYNCYNAKYHSQYRNLHERPQQYWSSNPSDRIGSNNFRYSSEILDSGVNSTDANKKHTLTKFTGSHTSSDNFWDFLKCDSSSGDYNEVLREVISSTVTSPCDTYITIDTGLTYNTDLPCQSNSTYSECGIVDKNQINLDSIFPKQNDSENQLPCISSVFSIKPYPNQFENSSDNCEFQTEVPQKYPLQYNTLKATDMAKHQQPCKRKTDENTVDSFKTSRTVYSEHEKEVLNKLTKHISDPTSVGCSQFVVYDNDLPSAATSSVHSLGENFTFITDSTVPNFVQKQSSNLNVANSARYNNNLSQGVKEDNITLKENIGQPLPITVEKLGINKVSSDNSKTLYVLLQNSETLRDPNYTHYLFIANNNTTNPQRPVLPKNAEVITTLNSTNNINNVSGEKNNLNQSNNSQSSVMFNTNQQLNSSHSSETLKLSISKEQISTRNVPSDSEFNYVNNSDLQDAIKDNFGKSVALTEFRNKFIQNTKKCKKGVNVQPTCINSTSILPNVEISKCQIPSSSEPIDISAWNDVLTHLKTNLSKITYKSKLKNVIIENSSKGRTPRPIKSISLGKHKNAVQQISTPERLDSDICTQETIKEHKRIFNIYPNTNQSYSNKNVATENTLQKHFNSVTDRKSLADSFQHSVKPLSNGQTIIVPSLTTSGGMAFNKILLQNNKQVNLSESNNNSMIFTMNNQSCTNNLMINQIPIRTDRNFKSSEQNMPHQIQIASSQNNPPVPIQRVFQLPINIVPVSVVPNNPSLTQSIPPKILIVQDSNQNKFLQPKLRVFPPKQNAETTKKSTLKIKKVGRKTVRELLQERHRSSKYSVSVEPQTTRREVRVLRPLCKIPCSNSSDVLPASGFSVTNKTRTGSFSNNPQNATLTKRPNIMILPSASKCKEEIPSSNSTVEDRQTDRDPFILDVSGMDISLPLSPGDDANRKCRRPRYYDMSELQIGYFKVEDDVDACGRFRSKFKAIFTKRQFLYDFPVSRCNQPSLKTSQVWEQMARISVPFKSITSMCMRDRIIHLNVNAAPQISLGTLSSRSGLFSNSTIYDIPVKSDSEWQNILQSSFNHKVVLRKRQTNKLKTSLCQFDRNFISLTSITTHGNQSRNDADPYLFGNEILESPPLKNLSKSRKSFIRRLPQWDYQQDVKQKTSNDEDLLVNQICACRTNCRSVRCSCVKAAKSCSFSGSMCQCLNCNNPLNVLETIGLDIEFSLTDSCLFQNIYQIPDLLNYLQREVRLECCNSFARVQDCIPGTVLCPNINCDTQLQYSWCHKMISYPERNPRNHCSFCGQCCFSSKFHCHTCKRCYAVSSKSATCPTCQKNSAYSNNMDSNECFRTLNTLCFDSTLPLKQTSKPEIVLLQNSGVSKVRQKPVELLKKNTPTLCDAADNIEMCVINGQLLIQDLDKLTENEAKEKFSQTTDDVNMDIREETEDNIEIDCAE